MEVYNLSFSSLSLALSLLPSPSTFLFLSYHLLESWRDEYALDLRPLFQPSYPQTALLWGALRRPVAPLLEAERTHPGSLTADTHKGCRGLYHKHILWYFAILKIFKINFCLIVVNRQFCLMYRRMGVHKQRCLELLKEKESTVWNIKSRNVNCC